MKGKIASERMVALGGEVWSELEFHQSSAGRLAMR